MYKKGKAIKKAYEIIEKEVKKIGDSIDCYNHNDLDLFQIASRYSEYAEILTKDKRFVIYNLWAAELFFEGRQIENKLTQMLDKTKKIKPCISNCCKLKRKLSELLDVQKEISEFQDDIYELQNCVTTTGINNIQGYLISTSQILSSVQQSEARIYDLILYKLNTINTKTIGWTGIFIGLCAVFAAIIK